MGDHVEQHGVHFDPATMQMFQAFAVFMQHQHATERREILATKAIQAVVNKMDQFDGKDMTKYLREYVKEMELHRVSKGEMIQSFELVVPKIREHVRVIRDLHGRNWEELKLALKKEYFMEDSERVTKRTFLEWVARPKEGLSVTELLMEFERRYAHITRMEKATLDAEKIELFLQAARKEFQEKLELLLEDKDAEQGLKTNSNEVEDAVSLLAKQQRRRDKMVFNTSNPILSTSDKMVKPHVIAPKFDESIMDDLVKGMRDLKVKLAKLEEKEQPMGLLSRPHKPKKGDRLFVMGGYNHSSERARHGAAAKKQNAATWKIQLVPGL
ncbi:hypothetical protein L7F22_022770 [Adiantum nelumboides]|nr:hypothetical protein [Adiantum nelumboides]